MGWNEVELRDWYTVWLNKKPNRSFVGLGWVKNRCVLRAKQTPTAHHCLADNCILLLKPAFYFIFHICLQT